MDEVFPVLWASALAAVIFLPTGYFIGYFFNLFGFRSENYLRRLAIALPVSMGTLPILLFLVDRWTGPRLGWILLAGSWAGVLACFLHERQDFQTRWRDTCQAIFRNWKWLLLPILLWLACAFTLPNWLLNGILYPSLVDYDYAKHTAVADALLRTGIPPTNPSFFPGRPLPIFYYYFWFLFPAWLVQLTGSLLTVHQAVCACTVWAGFGVWAMLGLWIQHQPLPGSSLRWWKWCLVLFFVTGLDLIPVLVQGTLGKVIHGEPYWLESIEWWNEQVSSWLVATWWVPHHLGGFTACLLAFLCWRTAGDQPSGNRVVVGYILVAGFSLASALGMSVWITVLAALVGSVWVLLLMIRRDWWEATMAVGSGLLGLVLAGPYFWDLKEANLQEGGFPLAFEIRHFNPAEFWMGFVDWPPLLRKLVFLILLPVNFLFEFGFFFLAGLTYWTWRRRQQDPMRAGERFLVLMLIVSLAAGALVRSVLKNNDFGWRGLMFAQFVLLLWGAPVLRALFPGADQGLDLTPSRRRFLWALLLAGFAGNLYELVANRVNLQAWKLGRDHPFHYPSLSPNQDFFNDVRVGYQWIRENLPIDAVVQHSVTFPGGRDAQGRPLYQLFDVEFLHGIYGNRQVAVADDHYGQLYGISARIFQPVLKEVLAVFEPGTSWEEVQKHCRALKIDWLVVRSNDAVWQEKNGWVWQRPAVFANRNVRVVEVGK